MICIDITRAIIEKAGIGRYTKEIVKNMLKIAKNKDFLLLSTHFKNSQEKDHDLEGFRKENTLIERVHIPGMLKEAAWGWPFSLWNNLYGESSVLFAPSFFEAKIGLDLPQVVVIHDLTTFLFPEQRGRKVSASHNKRVRAVCQKAQKIITPSQSTKNDIVKILGLPEDKIKVVYPGKTSFNITGTLPHNLKPKGYILTVGTIEPRKNLKRLVKACSNLPEKIRTEYPLVIVGAKGWKEREAIGGIKKIRRVKWLGYVSDQDLAVLYQNAAVFAYPSLYEGFGLPVIEAQQFGVPVVTSNLSSLPEAVGDGGIQVDPYKTEEITTALHHLLTDKKFYQTISEKALSNSQQFSWEKAARETFKILQEVENE